MVRLKKVYGLVAAILILIGAENVRGGSLVIEGKKYPTYHDSSNSELYQEGLDKLVEFAKGYESALLDRKTAIVVGSNDSFGYAKVIVLDGNFYTVKDTNLDGFPDLFKVSKHKGGSPFETILEAEDIQNDKEIYDIVKPFIDMASKTIKSRSYED